MYCQRATEKLRKPKISSKGPKWVADEDAEACKNCGFVFSFIIRRHHCRMCGKVYCRHCCCEKWPIPKYEYLKPVRVCRKCARNCWKAEALAAAIQNNDVGAIARYVERRNDCNLHIGVYPPLTVASSGGFARICSLLIQGGALVNHAVPLFSESVLVQCTFCLRTMAHERSKSGDYECVVCHEVTQIDEMQEARGLDHVGVTALHAAVQIRGHPEVVELLLEEGAEVGATNAKGDTALHVASAGGHEACVKLLLQHGAGASSGNNVDGDTPLHRAVRGGHVAVIKMLMEAGANPDATNNQGETSKQIADRRRDANLIAALTLSD